jgi:hypothetical protein
MIVVAPTKELVKGSATSLKNNMVRHMQYREAPRGEEPNARTCTVKDKAVFFCTNKFISSVFYDEAAKGGYADLVAILVACLMRRQGMLNERALLEELADEEGMLNQDDEERLQEVERIIKAPVTVFAATSYHQISFINYPRSAGVQLFVSDGRGGKRDLFAEFNDATKASTRDVLELGEVPTHSDKMLRLQEPEFIGGAQRATFTKIFRHTNQIYEVLLSRVCKPGDFALKARGQIRVFFDVVDYSKLTASTLRLFKGFAFMSNIGDNVKAVTGMGVELNPFFPAATEDVTQGRQFHNILMEHMVGGVPLQQIPTIDKDDDAEGNWHWQSADAHYITGIQRWLEDESSWLLINFPCIDEAERRRTLTWLNDYCDTRRLPKTDFKNICNELRKTVSGKRPDDPSLAAKMGLKRAGKDKPEKKPQTEASGSSSKKGGSSKAKGDFKFTKDLGVDDQAMAEFAENLLEIITSPLDSISDRDIGGMIGRFIANADTTDHKRTAYRVCQVVERRIMAANKASLLQPITTAHLGTAEHTLTMHPAAAADGTVVINATAGALLCDALRYLYNEGGLPEPEEVLQEWVPVSDAKPRGLPLHKGPSLEHSKGHMHADFQARSEIPMVWRTLPERVTESNIVARQEASFQ